VLIVDNVLATLPLPLAGWESVVPPPRINSCDVVPSEESSLPLTFIKLRLVRGINMPLGVKLFQWSAYNLKLQMGLQCSL
jgi:hypothetical protein